MQSRARKYANQQHAERRDAYLAASEGATKRANFSRQPSQLRPSGQSSQIREIHQFVAGPAQVSDPLPGTCLLYRVVLATPPGREAYDRAGRDFRFKPLDARSQSRWMVQEILLRELPIERRHLRWVLPVLEP